MKRKGDGCEYIRERDADLARAFDECMKCNRQTSVAELMECAVNVPSARFWVSEHRAVRIIRQMKRGNRLSCFAKNKREMFVEIWRRVCALRATEPRYSLVHAVRVVIKQRAPRFYLTPESAAVILSRHRKRARSERK
ncbi:MAG: hypothetical protein LUC22_01365 [Prevotella sp.]|nr:hypothetical protein [Prevotella sp.]